MDTSPERVVVLAATPIERRAAARRLENCEIVECGVALAKLSSELSADVAISFGLVGGLRDDLETGTLVIPSIARAPSGASKVCDPEWTQRLRDAAVSLGFNAVDGPMLTSDTIVSGAARAQWANEGFATVDMETAIIPFDRVAAVRVVLDTPRNELSPQWVNPARALRNPRNWPQALWLARNASRCADIAAQVMAKAWLTYTTRQ
jgi:hypothetical protein